MPHIVAKLRSGYSEEQKARLAKALSRTIVETLDCPNFDVSIGIEDVHPADWIERVCRTDILAKPDTIFKRPGYALSENLPCSRLRRRRVPSDM